LLFGGVLFPAWRSAAQNPIGLREGPHCRSALPGQRNLRFSRAGSASRKGPTPRHVSCARGASGTVTAATSRNGFWTNGASTWNRLFPFLSSEIIITSVRKEGIRSAPLAERPTARLRRPFELRVVAYFDLSNSSRVGGKFDKSPDDSGTCFWAARRRS
jgi:hypothetical protein